MCYMKRIAFILTLIAGSLGFQHMAFANTSNTNAAQAAGSINISVRPEIIGLWGMDIPSNTQCIEKYNFRDNSGLVIQSADEWSIAQYQYQVPSNRSEELPSLVMQIMYDNNQKDCSGNVHDQTGDVQKFFVKWVNPTQIQFCANGKGDQCFATLNRFQP